MLVFQVVTAAAVCGEVTVLLCEVFLKLQGAIVP